MVPWCVGIWRQRLPLKLQYLTSCDWVRPDLDECTKQDSAEVLGARFSAGQTQKQHEVVWISVITCSPHVEETDTDSQSDIKVTRPEVPQAQLWDPGISHVLQLKKSREKQTELSGLWKWQRLKNFYMNGKHSRFLERIFYNIKKQSLLKLDFEKSTKTWHTSTFTVLGLVQVLHLVRQSALDTKRH